MEHHFSALKGGDIKVRKYKSGNVTVIVKVMADRLAIVFDKDVCIYSISKLQEAINNHQEISRTISGRTYQELEMALDRLKGTTIKTNVFIQKKSRKVLVLVLLIVGKFWMKRKESLILV
ncbi:replication initiator protein A [Candidatus Williamhamiltonella defendens]|uniref:replication initiator protein A n=1 Tax=Candidatus Williamhamiltonella defendens TaxID=138072 RepID=UPI0022A6BBBC|nr:replication initiator protein A [Candidatus Hamiltonella defensa]